MLVTWHDLPVEAPNAHSPRVEDPAGSIPWLRAAAKAATLSGDDVGDVVDDQCRLDIAQNEVTADDAVLELLGKDRQRREQRSGHGGHLRGAWKAHMQLRLAHPRLLVVDGGEHWSEVLAADRRIDAPLDDSHDRRQKELADRRRP